MTTAIDEPTRYLLPAEAYWSPEWFERERSLFTAHWAMLGFLADVPEPGNWAVGYCGPAPVLFLRDRDGTLVAAHRTEDVHLGNGTPRGLTPQSPGLVACAVDTWAGMVFAHLGSSPMPLAEWLADFPTDAFVGAFADIDVAPVKRIRWPLAANWKLYIENHIDIYHLWYLHAESLGAFDHQKLTDLSTGPHWMCIEGMKDGQEEPRRKSLPRIPGISDWESRQIRANLLFPNLPWTTTSGNVVTTYQVIPTGPETSILDFRARAVAGSEMSDEDVASTTKVLYEEDGFACEQMQRVIKAPAFQVGPLAQRHERPIMLFHQNVLAGLPQG